VTYILLISLLSYIFYVQCNAIILCNHREFSVIKFIFYDKNIVVHELCFWIDFLLLLESTRMNLLKFVWKPYLLILNQERRIQISMQRLWWSLSPRDILLNFVRILECYRGGFCCNFVSTLIPQVVREPSRFPGD